jgi:hypothetical protein
MRSEGFPMRISSTTSLVSAAVLAVAVLVVSGHGAPTVAGAPQPRPTITVVPVVPTDITGGAQQAQIQQAAAFAWQEFIALNWPAQAGKRDTPDPKCAFADPKCAGQPRVWETFRAKIEIFPNQLGGSNPPNGYSPAAPDYGYDAPPASSYNGYGNNASPCPGQTVPAQAAWINLDEADEITVDQMYSGAAPSSPSPINSQPQLIRFLAKANRTEYRYVAAHGQDQHPWWGGLPPAVRNATLKYLKNYKADPPPGSTTMVSLPNNTIEIKAGWRLLTPNEATSGRYLTTTVRYYETSAGATCYHEVPSAQHADVFGLVALHIIQKTKTAPYFVYATFEQADNIVAQGADPNGTPVPVENDDGSVKTQPTCPPGQSTPCPTKPLEVLVDGPTAGPSGYPPQIVLQTPPANPKYCGTLNGPRPKNQLYYFDENPSPATPPYVPNPGNGFICVVQRYNPIPPEIIGVNDIAQQAIKNYPNGASSPWWHYKLVNVQYQPYSNESPGQPFTGSKPNTGDNPANFYLANIVVETNRSLQHFQGSLHDLIIQSDYASQFPPAGQSGSHKNMVYRSPSALPTAIGKAYDMGGCMGCHGAQGQTPGGNFSVILARGGNQNAGPEPPHPVGTAEPMSIRRLRYNRALPGH